jgi:hypothetical protein
MANHKMANHHWFVSVETPKQSQRGIRLHVRQTKAFPTQAEAKQFAKEMNSDIASPRWRPSKRPASRGAEQQLLNEDESSPLRTPDTL